MTAKKMADIFFGKFSELISKDSTTIEVKKEKTTENKIPREKKSQTKILIYLSVGISALVVIYLIIWIA